MNRSFGVGLIGDCPKKKARTRISEITPGQAIHAPGWDGPMICMEKRLVDDFTSQEMVILLHVDTGRMVPFPADLEVVLQRDSLARMLPVLYEPGEIENAMD